MTTKPKTRTSIVQAIARHKAAQAAIDAHSGRIDDDALAHKLFTAESDALNVVAETPCANDEEFTEKLRYLLAHEARIADGPPDGHQEFGSILVAVDRHFNVDRDFDQVPIASGARIGAAHDAAHPPSLSHLEASRALLGLAGSQGECGLSPD